MNNNSEEKHKKDLEAAKNWYKIAEQQNNEVAMNILKDLFPELNESGDIGTQLVNSIKSSARLEDCLQKHGFKIEEIIAWIEKQTKQNYIDADEDWYKFVRWFVKERTDDYTLIPSDDDIHNWGNIILNHARKLLEKQGEQKPSDKVEPKFKVGDFILNGDITNKGEYEIFKILKVCSHWYDVENIYDGRQTMITFAQEYICRLWTIEDAKDGDVLAEHETIVLFKKIEGQNIRCYCTYHYLGFNPTFYVGTLQNKNPYYPATKEQRDLLFSKMKETGYEWDAEKKELITIEHKSLSTEETELNSLAFLTELGYTCIPPTKEKPNGWSEEDELYLANAILATEKEWGLDSFTAKWLKSLKDRVKPQSKQEWNEEDEEIEPDFQKIQWKGNNLKEIVEFTGKSPKFNDWFKTWEEYENYVHAHNNIFKLFNEDGSHFEVPVGAWIVKTPDGYNVASKSTFIQNHKWSEEDEKNWRHCLHYIDAYVTPVKEHVDWFKNIRNRMQSQPQSKQEWSEEAKKMLDEAIKHVRNYQQIVNPANETGESDLTIWLQSLKPNHWKPSDLQLEALESAYKQLPNIQYFLQSLYNDLKNL